MDEDLRDDMDGDAPAKGGGGIMKIAIIAVIAIALGVGGFFAGKMFTKDNKEKAPVEDSKDKKENSKKDSKDKKETKDKKEDSSDSEGENAEGSSDEMVELKGKSKGGAMVLDPFTVNLNDPFGRRYAEVVMTLEISRKEYVSKINESDLVMPKLRDEIFMIISSKSYNELKSTAGKVTLKEEILMRVNEILKDEYDVEPITGVYFTKFLIQ